MPRRLNPIRYLAGAASHETDAELLGRFIDRRDEAAFALLVRRHGAMVYGVCRRLLSEHDAEDAFQATFLVLAEKARTAAPREVANWLYGVACKAALLSRRSIARRRERMGDVPEQTTRPDELRSLLDEELSRLPDVYRIVIVLCDLEGRTRREAANILGWPEGTVAGRLVRAREMLANRLAPAVSIAALLSGTASARVPDVLTPSATIPIGVAALTRELLGVITRGKLMKTVAALFLLGCVGFGMVLRAEQSDSAPSTDAPILAGSTEVPPPSKAEDVVWGKAVNGLQAGVGPTRKTYRPGEMVTMVVKLRNVGKAPVNYTYLLTPFQYVVPTVHDAAGKPVAVDRQGDVFYVAVPTKATLKPGEEVTLGPTGKTADVPAAKAPGWYPMFAIAPAAGWDVPVAYIAPGKHTVSYSGLLQSHPTLATGFAEIEVKDPKLEADREAFTVWGKEVGGIQAGLGFRSGGKRAYSHGETVTLVLRIRNVSKKEMTFSYLHPFTEHSPTVTDSEGKPVPQLGINKELGSRNPGQVNLQPDAEMELHELKRELRPASESDDKKFSALYGTGKVTVQYEQVLGIPSMGAPGWSLDPALSKLATGKLELEIKSEPPAAKTKPIKLRVYIEKVNATTSTITASCMILGKIDESTKPLRMENLRVAPGKAKITDRGKEVKLADLKLNIGYFLYLETYEGELGFEVIGIETIEK